MTDCKYRTSEFTRGKSGAHREPAYDNCAGVADDIRSLFEIYGEGEVPGRIECLAERLAAAMGAEAVD